MASLHSSGWRVTVCRESLKLLELNVTSRKLNTEENRRFI